MIKILLIFFILLLGCSSSKRGISCSDIYLPDCDYKNNLEKCRELEKEECEKKLDKI